MILAALLAQASIIVFLLDDVGAEDLLAVPTPNIDALATQGVTFTRAYAQPWCSPCRDSLYRSRWDGQFRGDSCGPPSGSVSSSAPTLAKVFDAQGYETTLVGKWHLGQATIPSSWAIAPHLYGWNHWTAGTAASNQPGQCVNPPMPVGRSRVDDGVVTIDPTHRTIQQRDAALAALPGFVLVAFSDAHSPWEIPPAEIMPPGYVPPTSPTSREAFEAEIMALDFVIGEIVVAYPDAWYAVIGDNGTPAAVDIDSLQGSKHSVYEGGVRVPFILSGPGLYPQTCAQPVSVVDVAPTLLAGIGVPVPAWMEGQSLVPAMLGQQLARDWVVVSNQSTGAKAAIEARWKLVVTVAGEAMYDLQADPGETTALPAVGADYDRLAGVLAAALP